MLVLGITGQTLTVVLGWCSAKFIYKVQSVVFWFKLLNKQCQDLVVYSQHQTTYILPLARTNYCLVFCVCRQWPKYHVYVGHTPFILCLLSTVILDLKTKQKTCTLSNAFWSDRSTLYTVAQWPIYCWPLGQYLKHIVIMSMCGLTGHLCCVECLLLCNKVGLQYGIIPNL